VTAATLWDAKHQTQRMELLNRIYLPENFGHMMGMGMAECSRATFDELPEQVQHDLENLSWDRL